MDVEFGDLIDYFGMDPQTKSIVLYVESISEARKFMTAARAFARKKPIIVYKAGRFPESAKAAASHTGAMASEDSIYDAVFQRAGIARVYNIGDIFDFTDLISRRRIPKGANLAIVTNAGGPGVMATDTLIASKGELVKLSDETMKKLLIILLVIALLTGAVLGGYLLLQGQGAAQASTTTTGTYRQIVTAQLGTLSASISVVGELAVNPEAVTPHTEAFQAVVWHLLVSHPLLKAAPTKWESTAKASAS